MMNRRLPPRLLADDARRSRARQAGTIAVALLGALAVDPNRPLPFDLCVFKSLLGIPCPACGLTRAVCHALRGDWAVSVSYHPAGVLLAAGLVGWMLWSAAEAVRGQPLAEAARGRLLTSMIGGGLVASIAAWIVQLAG